MLYALQAFYAYIRFEPAIFWKCYFRCTVGTSETIDFHQEFMPGYDLSNIEPVDESKVVWATLGLGAETLGSFGSARDNFSYFLALARLFMNSNHPKNEKSVVLLNIYHII